MAENQTHVIKSHKIKDGNDIIISRDVGLNKNSLCVRENTQPLYKLELKIPISGRSRFLSITCIVARSSAIIIAYTTSFAATAAAAC